MLFVVIVVLAINMLIISCRKKCYVCYEYSGEFVCHKGGDTISYNPFGITDPSYYTAMGYTCDTVALFWEQESPGNEICYPPQNLGPNDSCALIQ
jgi:hypothetical protein